MLAFTVQENCERMLMVVKQGYGKDGKQMDTAIPNLKVQESEEVVTVEVLDDELYIDNLSFRIRQPHYSVILNSVKEVHALGLIPSNSVLLAISVAG